MPVVSSPPPRPVGVRARHLLLITDFLNDHEAALICDGLAVRDEEGVSFRSNLLEALCTVGYSKSFRENRRRYWTFKYGEVVQKARQIAIDVLIAECGVEQARLRLEAGTESQIAALCGGLENALKVLARCEENR